MPPNNKGGKGHKAAPLPLKSNSHAAYKARCAALERVVVDARLRADEAAQLHSAAAYREAVLCDLVAIQAAMAAVVQAHGGGGNGDGGSGVNSVGSGGRGGGVGSGSGSGSATPPSPAAPRHDSRNDNNGAGGAQLPQPALEVSGQLQQLLLLHGGGGASGGAGGGSAGGGGGLPGRTRMLRLLRDPPPDVLRDVLAWDADDWARYFSGHLFPRMAVLLELAERPCVTAGGGGGWGGDSVSDGGSGGGHGRGADTAGAGAAGGGGTRADVAALNAHVDGFALRAVLGIALRPSGVLGAAARNHATGAAEGAPPEHWRTAVRRARLTPRQVLQLSIAMAEYHRGLRGVGSEAAAAAAAASAPAELLGTRGAVDAAAQAARLDGGLRRYVHGRRVQMQLMLAAFFAICSRVQVARPVVACYPFMTLPAALVEAAKTLQHGVNDGGGPWPAGLLAAAAAPPPPGAAAAAAWGAPGVTAAEAAHAEEVARRDAELAQQLREWWGGGRGDGDGGESGSGVFGAAGGGGRAHATAATGAAAEDDGGGGDGGGDDDDDCGDAGWRQEQQQQQQQQPVVRG